MISLNLPPGEFKYKNIDGTTYIFDIIRNKFILLTPEEWVRQNFVSYLINYLSYPQGLIGNELSLTQNGIKRRCDTLVADNKGNPLMIIEYKAPHIEITQDVFNQITRYNYVLKAKYIIVSNGLNHYCCRIDYSCNNVEFITDIPHYTML